MLSTKGGFKMAEEKVIKKKEVNLQLKYITRVVELMLKLLNYQNQHGFGLQVMVVEAV